jgi:hypothetical protein
MFDPIPPDLDIKTLVEKTPNFDYVIRISVDQINQLGIAEFEKLVMLHVIQGGKPLVVEGWNDQLHPWLYSVEWLENNVGQKQETVRDLSNHTNMPMTIGHYLRSMEKLTTVITPDNFRDPKRQRLYLKDIDCPEAWQFDLGGIVPATLFYWNDNVNAKGGLVTADNTSTSSNIAPAGDLMSNLPEEMRAENLMCYIGHEGTYTPAHREMCATLGQNIMVETSSQDRGEKPGSSIWFMTEKKDREVVSEYFLSMLGHDIEVEKHFAQLVAWKKAPFPVYIAEQHAGDLILIPPLAPHQVWNRGTRTMKVAWNRTTVETLELALNEALPRARMVCRDEQYKCKAIVYYSLAKYHRRLKQADRITDVLSDQQRVQKKQLQRDFKKLFKLYRQILISESFSKDFPKEKDVEFVPFDSNVTCSYCRCNIFNRFLTCKSCVGELANGDEDTYDVCMDCYAMGRSCACISSLKWVEQWQWPDLLAAYETWRAMVLSIDYGKKGTPLPLDEEIKKTGKKTMAHVCQEQLKRRPWRDITKPDIVQPLLGESDEEPEVDDEGRRVKKKRRRAKDVSQSITSCHICKHKELDWKLAFCTTCKNAYCYGSLWRAFDLKPEKIMEDPNWQCPQCLKMCSCGYCRRTKPDQIPYQPKGTLLGHETKLVADARSVESLVDFSKTNLGWLKDASDNDPKNSHRMRKLVAKAQEEKSREEVLDDELTSPIVDHATLPGANGMTIDPALGGSLEGESHAPIAPMMALQDHDMNDDGSFAESHQFVSPSDVLNQPIESEYPEPGGFGSNQRMMGVGYYKQRNDVDKILFSAPAELTPTGEHANVQYPRIHEEEDDVLVSGGKKKGPQRRGDAAHSQYLEAQKKQKLVEAKKENRFYMVRHQLEGGRPLRVRLSLPNHKVFLDKISRMDKDEIVAEASARPRRQDSTRDSSEESTESENLVRSDLAPAKAPTVPRIDDGDDDDEETPDVVNSRAVTAAKSMTGRRRGRLSNAERAQREAQASAKRGRSHSESSYEGASRRAKKPRRSTWLERKNAEEDQVYPEALSFGPQKKQKSSASAANAKSVEAEDDPHPPAAQEQSSIVIVDDLLSQDSSTPAPEPSDVDEVEVDNDGFVMHDDEPEDYSYQNAEPVDLRKLAEDAVGEVEQREESAAVEASQESEAEALHSVVDDYVEVDSDYNPIEQPRTPSPEPAANSYEDAKLLALKIAEEEMAAQNSKAKSGTSGIAAKTQPQGSAAFKAAYADKEESEELQEEDIADDEERGSSPPKPVFTSMAERMAAKGKKIKIVGRSGRASTASTATPPTLNGFKTDNQRSTSHNFSIEVTNASPGNDVTVLSASATSTRATSTVEDSRVAVTTKSSQTMYARPAQGLKGMPGRRTGGLKLSSAPVAQTISSDSESEDSDEDEEIPARRPGPASRAEGSGGLVGLRGGRGFLR